MTAKEYLSKLSTINEKLNNLNEELEEKKALLNTISSPSLSRNSFGSNSRNNALFIDTSERIEQLKEKISKEENKRNIIIDQIMSLDNAIYIHILLGYYDKGKEHCEIAQEIHYEYGYERKLHSRALNAFQKKFHFLKKGTKKNTKEH